jgi:hypothetical protein
VILLLLRAPTGCCATPCPGLPICAACARPMWTALPPDATTAFDRPSADPRPQIPSQVLAEALR